MGQAAANNVGQVNRIFCDWEIMCSDISPPQVISVKVCGYAASVWRLFDFSVKSPSQRTPVYSIRCSGSQFSLTT